MEGRATFTRSRFGATSGRSHPVCLSGLPMDAMPTMMFRGLKRATDVSLDFRPPSESQPASRLWQAETNVPHMDMLWEDDDHSMTPPPPERCRNSVNGALTSPGSRLGNAELLWQTRNTGRSHSEPVAGPSSIGLEVQPSNDSDSQDNEPPYTQIMAAQLPSILDGVPVTTLVLRNLPPRLTKNDLFQLLPPPEEGKYNVVHVPCLTQHQNSSGYALLNFQAHEDAVAFHSDWHGRVLQGTRSDAIGIHRVIKISAAEQQGFFTNMHRWRKTLRHQKDPALLPTVYIDGQRRDFWQVARDLRSLDVRAAGGPSKPFP